MLSTLLRARGHVVSPAVLLEQVWGYTAACEVQSQTVATHVYTLRQKLGRLGRQLVTVAGVGYRFDADGTDD